MMKALHPRVVASEMENDGRGSDLKAVAARLAELESQFALLRAAMERPGP